MPDLVPKCTKNRVFGNFNLNSLKPTFHEQVEKSLRQTASTATPLAFNQQLNYGTKVIGVCQNALFCPVGSRTVTWQS